MPSEDWQWSTIEAYFREDRYRLTRHHLQSYNDMVKVKIPFLIHDKNKLPEENGEFLVSQNGVDIHMIVGKNHDDVVCAFNEAFKKAPSPQSEDMLKLTINRTQLFITRPEARILERQLTRCLCARKALREGATDAKATEHNTLLEKLYTFHRWGKTTETCTISDDWIASLCKYVQQASLPENDVPKESTFPSSATSAKERQNYFLQRLVMHSADRPLRIKTKEPLVSVEALYFDTASHQFIVRDTHANTESNQIIHGRPVKPSNTDGVENSEVKRYATDTLRYVERKYSAKYPIVLQNSRHLVVGVHGIVWKLRQVEKPENTIIDYLTVPSESDNGGSSGNDTLDTHCFVYITDTAPVFFMLTSLQIEHYLAHEPHGHLMTPNFARMQNLTYEMSIHVDILFVIRHANDIHVLDDVGFFTINADKHTATTSCMDLHESHRAHAERNYKDVRLLCLPIMLHSDFCTLKDRDSEQLRAAGECRFDRGGYFVVHGREKVVVCQEFSQINKVYTAVRLSQDRTSVRYGATISCTKRNAAPSENTIEYKQLKAHRSGNGEEGHRSVCGLPTPRGFYVTVKIQDRGSDADKISFQDVPLFILMRALGIDSDKDILEILLGDDVMKDKYAPILQDMFYYSVCETSAINTRAKAFLFLGQMLKESTGSRDKRAFQDDTEGAKLRRNMVQKVGRAVRRVLLHDLLPHIEMEKDTTLLNHQYAETRVMRMKALYLGMMVRKIMHAYLKTHDMLETATPPTTAQINNAVQRGGLFNADKDAYSSRRISLSGDMLANLFRQAYEINIYKKTRSRIRDQIKGTDESNMISTALGSLLQFSIQSEEFNDRFRLALSGQEWGFSKDSHVGYVQELERISFLGSLSYLRRLHKELPSTGDSKKPSKLVPPRRLHTSQWGMICPLETPDGGKIGLLKHLAMFSTVSPLLQRDEEEEVRHFIETYAQKIYPLRARKLQTYHTIVYNGTMEYALPEKPSEEEKMDPREFVEIMRLMRRNGLISPLCSIAWRISQREIEISTQEGRVLRPLVLIPRTEDRKTSLAMLEASKKNLVERLRRHSSRTWGALLSGTATVISDTIVCPPSTTYHNLSVRFSLEQKGVSRTSTKAELMEKLQNRNTSAIIEYLDTEEINTLRIAPNERAIEKYVKEHGTDNDTQVLVPFEHVELHNSAVLGIIGMCVPFIEHNAGPRNLFACHQSKQSVGVFSTSFHHRMDKSTHILDYGQKPLASSRYFRYINEESLPYGSNALVAICCYGGFNIEDSLLFNEGSVQRGLLRSTYFRTCVKKEKTRDADGGKLHSDEAMIKVGAQPSQRVDRSKYYAIDAQTGVVSPDAINTHRPLAAEDVLIEAYSEKNATTSTGSRVDRRDESVRFEKPEEFDTFLHRVYLSTSRGGDGACGREMTERCAKVSTRTMRYPTVGDKFAIRAGQKGTIGGLIPEASMPFIGECIPDIKVRIKEVKTSQQNENITLVVETAQALAAGPVRIRIPLKKTSQLQFYSDVEKATDKGSSVKLKLYTTARRRTRLKGALNASKIKATHCTLASDGESTRFFKGLSPDIIMNPHALPSRMTAAQLYESLFTVLGCYEGRGVDATPLSNMGNIKTVSEAMRARGFHPYGEHYLYNGQTGERMKAQVFIGLNYVMRLKHMPADKCQSRREGRVDAITHQAVAGRARGGGLRIGEMERDCLISHGSAKFLHDSLSRRGDRFEYDLAKRSGVVEPRRKIYDEEGGNTAPDHYRPLTHDMSDGIDVDVSAHRKVREGHNRHTLPMFEGFNKYVNTLQRSTNDTLQTVDGRDLPKHTVHYNGPDNDTFRVAVPHAYKLMTQEMGTAAVNMRTIPESAPPLQYQPLNDHEILLERRRAGRGDDVDDNEE